MRSVVTLGSRRVYTGKILNLRVDTIRLPDAQPVEREIVEHPGSVVMAPLTDRGAVILVRQWRQPAGTALLELPAGTIDPDDESPEATAQRELQEEIGFEAGRLTRLGSFWIAPGWATEYMHAFIATELKESRLNPDPDEDIRTEEQPLERVPELIRSGAIQDAKSICALLLAIARGPERLAAP